MLKRAVKVSGPVHVRGHQGSCRDVVTGLPHPARALGASQAAGAPCGCSSRCNRHQQASRPIHANRHVDGKRGEPKRYGSR
jgi:hypothetical protein